MKSLQRLKEWLAPKQTVTVDAGVLANYLSIRQAAKVLPNNYFGRLLGVNYASGRFKKSGMKLKVVINNYKNRSLVRIAPNGESKAVSKIEMHLKDFQVLEVYCSMIKTIALCSSSMDAKSQASYRYFLWRHANDLMDRMYGMNILNFFKSRAGGKRMKYNKAEFDTRMEKVEKSVSSSVSSYISQPTM